MTRAPPPAFPRNPRGRLGFPCGSADKESACNAGDLGSIPGLGRSLEILLPPIPPSIRVFSNESTLRTRWPKYWSFSFSIIPSKENWASRPGHRALSRSSLLRDWFPCVGAARHDEDLREPLVRRQGSQVSMRVARGGLCGRCTGVAVPLRVVPSATGLYRWQ